VNLRFVAWRLVGGISVLFGVTVVTFVIAHLIPVNPVIAWIGRGASVNPQLAGVYIQRYHLNSPLYVQYFYYVYGLLHLDLGFSPTKGEPVMTAIFQTFPYTLQILFFTMIFVVLLGIPAGIIAAKYANKLPDRAILGFYIFGTASPPFFIALVLILIFSLILPILPTGGSVDPLLSVPNAITGIPMLDALIGARFGVFLSLLSHVILPSLALALTLFGLLTRVLRTNMLELLGSNFVRASRARGYGENKILFLAFKNSLVSVVTLISVLTIFALVGDIFVEDIFAYPGLGQYAVQAALASDYPAILGTTLFYAFIIVIVNVVADLLYAFVDPRIRYGQ